MKTDARTLLLGITVGVLVMVLIAADGHGAGRYQVISNAASIVLVLDSQTGTVIEHTQSRSVQYKIDGSTKTLRGQ